MQRNDFRDICVLDLLVQRMSWRAKIYAVVHPDAHEIANIRKIWGMKER